ncbi:hypothetical protein K1T35_48225 (plasmid) [Pseudonocardia sp. DSM 110487]|uniref:hypothetical protein n=1 Tax=Pseudonocardia sp. DSM 110487 TaxID=2865833 RepID=UPI001C69806D|nr:hypothetical protein [Pseudonocardia sp. DSM 110487]QYN41136.1 hypothetical protein K1T35_48225 [Pseudonocardia sp. DSM 110487]
MSGRGIPDPANRPQGGNLSAEDRERAVNDVLADMSIVGTAVMWGVLAADPQRWVEEAQPDASAS